ncbi:hypothetical protein [Paenibacillus sp. KN14-4R]|uniref:hypothetical protein n=1 Tax=Paenibacillus sp. KN14-4R TaxID=3445773 RepID=UPI003F9F597F
MPNQTPNLGLQKPIENENYDINVNNENMNKIDGALGEIRGKIANVVKSVNSKTGDVFLQAEDVGAIKETEYSSHLADYVKHVGFAVSDGTATAYTITLNPPPTSITAGMTFRFKSHVDSGVNPTINPNGLGAKTVKKSNGNAATFKKDGVYTVTYDGSSAFILQGEGGEYGTATANEVLQGYTIATEKGLVNGSINKQVLVDSIGRPATSTDTIAQLVTILQSDKNTLASLLNGKGIGSSGTEALLDLINKVNNFPAIGSTLRYASGTRGPINFNYTSGYSDFFSIVNLSFKPKQVFYYVNTDRGYLYGLSTNGELFSNRGSTLGTNDSFGSIRQGSVGSSTTFKDNGFDASVSIQMSNYHNNDVYFNKLTIDWFAIG